MLYNRRIAKADEKFDKKHISGPFDIVGDIHGCFTELKKLLQELGYSVEKDENIKPYGFKISPPGNRQLIFVGDLVDRGPDSVSVLKVAMTMTKQNMAFCIPGNHDEKFMRKMLGRNVLLKHGLEKTVEQIKPESSHFKKDVLSFLENMSSYLIFDQGKLIIAHAGLKQDMQGKHSKEIREFCLYGESTGNYDQFGLPERINWAKEYKGSALVVYGHTAVEEPYVLNNTIDIDTGCVFGGKLTALRYPEMEFISVKAEKEYSEKKKPFGFID